jgi:hypothetical protein
MTLVIDLETGTALHAHKGKDTAALILFLEKAMKRSDGS